MAAVRTRQAGRAEDADDRNWSDDEFDDAKAFLDSVLGMAYAVGVADAPGELPVELRSRSEMLRLANHWRRQLASGIPITPLDPLAGQPTDEA